MPRAATLISLMVVYNFDVPNSEHQVRPPVFQSALKSSGFYKQAQTQFGPEACALLTKYTGPIG